MVAIIKVGLWLRGVLNGGCGGLVAMEDGHNTFKVMIECL
jgi:hypothetical protein